MQPKQITWIGFLIALSTLNISPKAIASQGNLDNFEQENSLEFRLGRIAENLQEREEKLADISDIDIEAISGENLVAGGWLKGYRRSFIDGGRHGGGFLNRRRWPDRGGFWNRRWPDGGGFLNRW